MSKKAKSKYIVGHINEAILETDHAISVAVARGVCFDVVLALESARGRLVTAAALTKERHGAE